MRGKLWMALVCFGGFLLVSCGQKAAVTKETLAGKWVASGQAGSPQAETWEIGADGKVVMTSMGTRHEGTYTLSGSTLEIKFSDLPAAIKWGVSFTGSDGMTIRKGRSSRDWFDYQRIK